MTNSAGKEMEIEAKSYKDNCQGQQNEERETFLISEREMVYEVLEMLKENFVATIWEEGGEILVKFITGQRFRVFVLDCA